MSKPSKLSGLQRQVLSLYRSALRLAREKDGRPGGQMAIYARTEFERNKLIEKKNFQLAEHYLRKGRKQLELLSQSDVTGLRVYRSHGS